MPTISDVIRLRKAGQLNEALVIADELNMQHPGHKVLLTQYAWIFFGKIKEAVINRDGNAVHQMLDKILRLGLDLNEEKFLGNQLGYKVYSLVKDWSIDEQKQEIKVLIQKVSNFGLDVKSDAVPTILMLRLFLKTRDAWTFDEKIHFLDWASLDQLPDKEYQPYITDNGRPIMPLAEQAYIAYAQAWGNLLKSGAEFRAVDLMSFKSRLSTVMKSYPRYKFLPYLFSKILLHEGNAEKALSFMTTFVKTNAQQYWAWSGMGSIFESLGQTDSAIISYAKAISLEKEEGFIVKVRQSFGNLLRAQGKDEDAKFQFEKSIETRANSGYKIPADLKEIQISSWFHNTTAAQNDASLIRELTRQSDQLLYADLPLAVGVVTGINPNKQGIFIMADRGIQGFARVHQWSDYQPGDFVEVRIEERKGESETYYTFPVIQPTTKRPSNSLILPFSGTIEKRGPNTFGFVNDEEHSVFIPQFLAASFPNRTHVSGLAIQSFDKKKEKWGWKALRLNS